MISRQKLNEILTKHQQDLLHNSVQTQQTFSMNQAQSIKRFDRKLMTPARYAKKPTDKAFVYDARNNIDTVHGDNIGGNNSALTLRKSKTPIESMEINSSVFSIFKPDKKYAAEAAHNEEEVDNSEDDTFHRAVGPILFLGQFFAVLPVSGVLSATPKGLKFTFKSLPVVMTLMFMGASTILTLTTLKHLLNIGINAKNVVGVVFFSCVQISCLLFASLSRRWPKMMRYWYRTEMIFTRKPYEILKRNLAWRVRLSACIIILLSTVEHGLYLSSAITSYRLGIQLCASVTNSSGELSFGDYVRRNYDYVFQILPYSPYVGVFILIVNGACTFIWNYMDMFVMMVSKGIAYRFEQITTRINKLANKEVPESVFIEIREHYVKMCELLECIDDNLSGIILLSCLNNLYFVCIQLLNIFNKLRWPINYIYFWYSLLYLIGRTAFVFLSAASINDQSCGGLGVLRRVSNKTWCVEVERLIFQMSTQTVALSGKKFYYLTRRLLFGMAGTIVTYELVLLQFDEPNRAKGLPALCSL